MKKARKGRLWLGMSLVVLVVVLCLGEIIIRTFSPTEYLSPRYQFSPEYGIVPFANAVMVHGVPGKYQFHYTVNAISSRGDVIQPGESGLPAVVVLGDSYAFGMGVSDGEEFPSVMQRELAGRIDVANLASPGWGLTQEIRRYADLGRNYHPKIVVLEFCGNDPEDNFANQVTRVKDGALVFVDSDNSTNLIKKFMSRSPLQRTQTYNFFRTRLSMLASQYIVRQKTAENEKARASEPQAVSVPVVETVYVELLSAFARDLRAEGVELWVIAVDNHLKQFPHIEQAINELAGRGELRYLEMTDWLRDHPDHGSPEGHQWGTVAHRVIGERLAAEATAALAGVPLAPTHD